MNGIPALELLGRNRGDLSGAVCMLGAPGPFHPQPPSDSLHALTTDFGQWERQGGHSNGWYFGYDDEALPSSFDTVVIFMPKAKAELSMRCAWALSRVTGGGEIWLVGAKREGIAGGSRQFRERFPEAHKADSARHCQLWKIHLGDDHEAPAFDSRDWISPLEVTVGGQTLSLFSMPGLFSEGRLDAGTRLLLETIEDCPKGPVLDFACGNGVVGAWLSRKWPDLELTLSDVQWQALTCARRAFSGSNRVTVVGSDGLSRLRAGYGTIITNPPFHQGVDRDASVTESLIGQAGGHLAVHGELRLVANAFLPYTRLIEKAFGRVSVLADDGDFRVYQARKQRYSGKK